ncbi:hypothetical protein JCGZ_26274 [Jatropha curcas]|uniref:Uncharacterized protein n=1 Tax=Jatropha curcas TaxID=180498 RepID=A0A067JI09_JATCU|nr:uncharacterized protein LOC105648628 [Jatropha curcas]KDP22443.1 hypothetical protein JCGZ_26274 [Jatropha curcas]
MFGGGKGMGGGGHGGSMIKVVGRTVTRAGVTNLQETISSSSNTTPTSPTSLSRSTHKLSSSNNVLSLASGPGNPFSACSTPISANSGGPNATYWPAFGPHPGSCYDDYEWVSVDGSEEEISVSDDLILGPVPSVDEVNSAVSALKQVFDAASYSQMVTDKFSCTVDKDVDEISSPTSMQRHISPVGSDSDWMEPSPNLCHSRILHPYGPDRVYDAFHLLQNEPSIQRMVISLSSDRAVWNAVLNNEAVRELRETFNAEENNTSATTESSDETHNRSNPTMDAVRWIFENTKAKFMEAIEKITMLMNELFKTTNDEKTTTESGTTDPFEEKLRTSFLLSVVVLLVVVVTRAHIA